MTLRVWLSIAGMMAVAGAVLFGAAGTIGWANGWWFLALFGGSVTATSWALARKDPALLAERMKGLRQEGQPLWDRIFLNLTQFVWWGWLLLMGLDGGRFGWWPLPGWLVWAGRIGIVVSFWAVYRCFRANSFTAPVVRIQEERGHRVISTGPYAIVRHPMYAAAAIMLVSMALALGSGWGVVSGFWMEIALAYRIGGEERLLRAGLPGYIEYTRKVRYRLIPFIW
jgi:protein-S-isoprenylcysteine O-methyltransferase Ste14